MRHATGARIDAEALTVRTGQGTVFSGLDLSVAPGGLTVLHSDSGGGRTALLLTLSGRMRPTAGRLRVDGYELPRKARTVRRIATLALCAGVNDLDDRLRVAEHLRERMLMRLRPAPRSVTRSALASSGLSELDTDRLVGDLSMAEKHRLGVALALLDEPRLVLVDNADDGIGPGQQRKFWRLLRDIADSGPTVVATCTDGDAASDLAEVIPLRSSVPHDEHTAPARSAKENDT